MRFDFGEYKTEVFLSREIPGIDKIASDLGFAPRMADNAFRGIIVCDENTLAIAEKIRGPENLPLCVLKSGEDNKNWKSVEEILSAAQSASLGRDGVFIGAGGGVITDMAGFASSIYMRGCRLVLVSTTLLGMVDASVGGKTGFDLFGIKNLAGSFYPAESVYMPLDCLTSLPEKEWKSGMAELLKTAVLNGDDFLDEAAAVFREAQCSYAKLLLLKEEKLRTFIERAVRYKGGIVTEDLKESGLRMLLNLGHTFGHALEAAAGLGSISHGEAVAWGIARACELGFALGITPKERAEKIRDALVSFAYDISCPHPFLPDTDAFFAAMNSDKKKKSGKLTFIVPDEKSARRVTLESKEEKQILEKIINGGFAL